MTAIEHGQTGFDQEYASYVGFSLDFSMKGLTVISGSNIQLAPAGGKFYFITSQVKFQLTDSPATGEILDKVTLLQSHRVLQTPQVVVGFYDQ